MTTATTTLNELVTVNAAGNDTNYVSLSTACVATVIATCNVTTIASTGPLTNASLTLGANVPAGNSFTVTLIRQRRCLRVDLHDRRRRQHLHDRRRPRADHG